MLQTFLLAVPMALVWMIIARSITLESLLVGYIFGFGIVFIIRLNTGVLGKATHPIRISRLPASFVWLLIYAATLSYEILISGIDVARRILPRKMLINPGTLRISTQDETRNPMISALSAHWITITPGSLVVDYDESDDSIMFVHVLDTDRWTEEDLNQSQTKQLRIIKGLLGHD